MQKTISFKNLNTSLELFPLESLKKASFTKGKVENLKKEYYSIDDIKKITQE